MRSTEGDSFMGKGRLEAFSDGVLAIIITIMVLELKVPHGPGLADLRPLIPVILSYVLSFIYLGIYWNNHHHMLHAVQRVNGRVLWANLHLLFWLSLVPFVTGWMGENHFGTLPTAMYGVVLLLAAIAYTILQWSIIAHQGTDSPLHEAVGADLKGRISIVLYLAAILLAFLSVWISLSIYALVAMMWLVPDRRIEGRLNTARIGK
jgi:TMEM175 potassium channel family protein